jgi:hypothetical protein
LRKSGAARRRRPAKPSAIADRIVPATPEELGEIPPGAGAGIPRIGRRRSRLHGWGVFALEPINKNKRIIHYAGEKVPARESERRESRYLEQGCIWCFMINRAWSRDAGVGGNIARFINHSCRPNCYSEVAGDVIWIRAARNLQAGEELTYNYYTNGDAEIPCRCHPGCGNML